MIQPAKVAQPMVIPPPVAPKVAPAPPPPKDGGDSITMETDDGFETFKVAGKDKQAVAGLSKEAAETKKKCGCECGPTGEPSAAEQVKK